MTDKNQQIVTTQDGILPERDAARNSEQHLLTREALEEQWQAEHHSLRPDMVLLGPFLDGQVDILVHYADSRLDRVMPFSQAWLFAVDAYMTDELFAIYAIRADQGPAALIAYYDGDVIRSEHDQQWARAWIKAGVDVILEVAAIRHQRSAPSNQAAEEPGPESSELVHDTHEPEVVGIGSATGV